MDLETFLKVLRSFMACVEDEIREMEDEEFGKGLDIDMYSRIRGLKGTVPVRYKVHVSK